MPVLRVTFTVRLFLQYGDQMLFLAQTDRNGGGYTMIGGRVEREEFAKDALIRETYEEAGIKVRKKDLDLVHLLYKKYKQSIEVIMFFRATQWEGVPIVKEPDKFKDVVWFPGSDYPPKLPRVLKYALKRFKNGKMYSEYPKIKKVKRKKLGIKPKTKGEP